jgi:exodeoxyribonuclease-5
VKVTEQQALAIEFLNDWIDSKELVACLQGYAGTGKTWLMGYWIAQLLKKYKNWRIVVIAPTNKAVDVLRSKCGDLDVEFMTIARFLGKRIKKNDDGETIKSRGKGQETPDLIICDEGSMVDNESDVDLRSKRCRLLYVGDPAQLPPINEEISNAFKVERKFLLTEIVRYDGAIIKVATFLRERIENKEMFLLGDLRQFKEDDPALTFTKLHNLHDWALSALSKGLDTRIVAFTNMDVNNHNAVMHKALFPDAPFFGIGEKVIVNETFELPGTGKSREGQEEQEMLYNGEMLTVVSCQLAEPSEGVVIYNVGVVRGDKSKAASAEYILPVAFDEQQAITVHKELTNKVWELRRENRHAEVKAVIDKRRPLNLLAPLRHSYACTVHKSQGSTYDVAFCDWTSIYQSRDRARMMYVAATRPSKYLVLAAK